MNEEEEKLPEEMIPLLQRIARELTGQRKLMSELVRFMRDAESEMPEYYRRFTNGMHDVHDIKYMYEDVGSVVPQHIMRECERLDDRFRQILSRMNAEGGEFNKIRREMAADPENRWDHTRLLDKPKENGSEARKSE